MSWGAGAGTGGPLCQGGSGAGGHATPYCCRYAHRRGCDSMHATPPDCRSMDASTQAAGPAESAVSLLLLPGLDGTDVFFEPLLQQLPPWIRARTVQFPDAGPYDYASLLELVRQALADTPACYVLASSFSGPLAVMLAASEPEKVRGLILGATFLRAPRRLPAALRLVARAPAVAALRWLRRLPVWVLRTPDDPLRQAKRRTWAQVSARALAGRARAVLGADVRDLLSRCPQPLLCVAYAEDRVVARRYAQEIMAGGASARLVTLPGGHLGMFADPAALAAEILRFVEAAA